MRPLLRVSKSHVKLALALRGMGHRVSGSRIRQLLDRLGYRRQVNRKEVGLRPSGMSSLTRAIDRNSLA